MHDKETEITRVHIRQLITKLEPLMPAITMLMDDCMKLGVFEFIDRAECEGHYTMLLSNIDMGRLLTLLRIFVKLSKSIEQYALPLLEVTARLTDTYNPKDTQEHKAIIQLAESMIRGHIERAAAEGIDILAQKTKRLVDPNATKH